MNNFIQLTSYAKPYWPVIIIAIISSIFYGIFNAASLWIVGTLIGTLFGSATQSTVGLEGINQKISLFFDNIILNQNPIEQLKMVCICLFVAFIFKNIFFYINWVTLSFVQLNMVKDLRNHFYKSILSSELSFFDTNKTGDMLSIILNDINWIKLAFTRSFQTFFHEFVSMIILFYMLFSISPSLTGITLMMFPISGYLIIKISQSIKRKTKRASMQIGDLSSYVEEKLIGIKVVKAFNMKLQEIRNFANRNYKFYKLEYNQQKLFGLSTPINDIIGISLAVCLLWYGGTQVLSDTSYLTSDNFMRYIIFLFAMLQPTRKLGSSFGSLQMGLAASERVFKIINRKISVKSNNKLINIIEFDNCIHFKNLSFKYKSSSKNILNNINIKINKGDKVALVGKSGSGKTTFSNLLLKFYKTNPGELFIDDIDYLDVNTISLRKLIGIVTQEPILFSGTIKENICYGNKSIDEKFIFEAAETACIDQFINSLELGYNTQIGERGTMLSGGQKQRLSIARAVLNNPSILIFDEATSSLDSESEEKVQNAIDNLVKDRTVIMIAHRLTTIKNANKIIVFNEGNIVESGTHDELISKDSYYKKLYNIQSQNKDE
jgi:subfamily B ATP-binding cassette protein MsbA